MQYRTITNARKRKKYTELPNDDVSPEGEQGIFIGRSLVRRLNQMRLKACFNSH